MVKRTVILWLLFSIPFKLALADESVIRWTGAEDTDSSISHIIQTLNKTLHLSLSDRDFMLQEDRDLAFNHYQKWVQLIDQVPVRGKSIRIWRDLNSNHLIQMEASLENSTNSVRLYSVQSLQAGLNGEETLSLIREKIFTYSEDPHIQGLDWKDEWHKGELVRSVKIRGKRGYHFVQIDLHSRKITSYRYREFPQVDQEGQSEYLSIPAQVYPVYEEVEGKPGKTLPRIPVLLQYVRTQVPEVNGDIYASLKNNHYYDFKYDPLLGQTSAGRSEGYWAMSYLKQEGEKIREHLPAVLNEWSKGVLLQGRYATINIHPDAIHQFGNLNFKPQLSSALFLSWTDAMVDGKSAQEMVPVTAYSGKPLHSAQEAWNRSARRLADHNPGEYINDGFDEIQVYYAINTLFETLQARGFKDPDLSTRPFNAFLFNPDIAYRDNAFYTEDTINFTTYSSHASNAARDNSTIWHELGHGVMDRLMGDSIELADTGGLSEGMADFVAALVIEAVTHGTPFPGSQKFRIINKTGFFLTNEVHDDGEAYGGAMKDFMDAVIQHEGHDGLNKVTDVVLEAMRLTRDYPGLTASEWFKHLLFADSLGRPGVREPGELKSYLLPALAGRNFKMDGTQNVASFSLVNAASQQEIVAGKPGSRDYPIPVNFNKRSTAKFQLQASVKNSDEFKFRFPVQVRVQYNGGALQGAIHWIGKEKGTQVYTLNSESDVANIPLELSSACDAVNRSDGSCVDYAYVQIWSQGESQHPTAKKRFYLKVKNST